MGTLTITTLLYSCKCMQKPDLISTTLSVEPEMQVSRIAVQTSARLHMGFFDLHGGLGRKFGGIGLALNAPQLELVASLSHEPLQVTMSGNHDASSHLAVLAKVKKITQQMIDEFSLKGYLNLHLEHHIAEHAGLGSGTQLALAIGTAISRLYHLNLSPLQIAQITGRGSRSGIGMAAFSYGGVLIDGGRATGKVAKSKLPPLLARYDFPGDWRVLLILDATLPGMHGEEEILAFNQLPEFSANLAAHLCRHVLMQAMPALAEHDLSAFGESIQELQSHVGDYFAPAQGGRYASPLVEEVLMHLKYAGVKCFGQSSWGPTGFAVFENEKVAEEHLKQLKAKFTSPTLSWMVCSARNHEATIRQLL